jgi:hypothetical protein
MKLKALPWIIVLILLATGVQGALTDNMIAYYSFDIGNVSGENMTDLSGNGNQANCTNMGGDCNTVAGKLGNASDFIPASNNYIDVSDKLMQYQPFTISAWVKFDDLSSDRAVIRQWATGKQNFMFLFALATGTFGGYSYDGNTDSAETNINTGEWYHLVSTYNDVNNTINLYVNGSWVSGSGSGVRTASTADDARIGQNSDGTDDMDGLIDEMGIWNRTLNSTEIADLYNGGTGFNPYAGGPGPGPGCSNITITAKNIETAVALTGFNATIWNGSINYTFTTAGNSITTNISNCSNSLFTIVTRKQYYFTNTTTSVNVSSGTFNANLIPYMKVRIFDQYDNQSLNETIITYASNYYYPDANNITHLPIRGGNINFQVNKTNYFTRTYTSVNSANDYNATIYQAILRIQARDSVTNTSLNQFYAQIPLYNINTTNGTAYYTVKAGTYNYTISKSGYQTSTGNITINALQTLTTTVYLNPLITFTLYKEADGTLFNVSTTNITELRIICPASVTTLDFKTTNQSNYTYPVTCAWDVLKIDVTVGASPYFRTLIPDHTETDIQFYLIDLTSETAVQTILLLNDLTGMYIDGILRVKRFVAGVERDIIEQSWDVEGKVNLYLIKNGYYTISLIDTNGQELSLGELIADSAGEKTITVPEIPFIPESYLGDQISWTWNFNTTRIRLQYNDTSSTGTTNLTFTVYNGSNMAGPALYSTTSHNITYTSISYILPDVNESYLACMQAIHPVQGLIEECKEYYNGYVVGDWSAWSAADALKWKNWASAFIIVILLLLFSSHIAVGMAFCAILMFAMIQLQWLTFGNTILNYVLLGLWVVITVIIFYTQGGEK